VLNLICLVSDAWEWAVGKFLCRFCGLMCGVKRAQRRWDLILPDQKKSESDAGIGGVLKL
jgi:hypothetical protein